MLKAATSDGDYYVVKGSKSEMMIIGPGRSTTPKLYPKATASRLAKKLNDSRTATDIKIHGNWEACPVKFDIVPDPKSFRPVFVKE